MSKPLYICDIDGTVADSSHRAHLLESKESSMSSMYQRYLDCPEKALEAILSKNGQHFTWVGGTDKEGTRYGSYKTVTRRSLEGRSYRVYWGDYTPSIEWLDVWFNPRTNKYEPR